MTKKIKLSNLTDMFKGMDVEALEGVTIEGDIELDLSGGGVFDSTLAYSLGHEAAQIAVHLVNISRLLGYPVEQIFAGSMGQNTVLNLKNEITQELNRLQKERSQIVF